MVLLHERTKLIALLLFSVFLLLWWVWRMMLILQSPLEPFPMGGQTVPLTMVEGVRPFTKATVHYIKPAEAWIDHALVVAALLVPGTYLAWQGFRRRRKR